MDSYLNNRVLVYRNFFDKSEADKLFAQLKTDTQWLSPSYTNADGTVVHLPRLTANYGEKSYDYSGLVFQPLAWTDLLKGLKNTADSIANNDFNALILQFYRDGSDKINWHADDDPCVGQNPVIVSMSFGDSRGFWFRSNAKLLYNKKR